MQAAIEILANHYNFDAEEGMRIVRKDKPKKKKEVSIPLPFCGKVNENMCNGIRLNHGLYSQCTNKKGATGFCKTCQKQADRNNGTPTYGTIQDRLKEKNPLDYRDPKGKRVVPYANVMEKLGITKEQAIEAADKLGWTISEENFTKRVLKKGRPAKKKSDKKECKEKKPRGRPRKQKKVVTEEVDNLVESLVNQAKESISKSEPEKEPESEPEKEPEKEPEPELETEPESESEEEEEKEVSKVIYNDTEYLEDNEGFLYDIETHELVGKWDAEKECVV